MSCPHCLSTSISKRKRRTSLGYRTFHYRDCGRRFNERSGTPFNDLQFPTDIVLLSVLWHLRYKLGFRDVAELLLQRGFEVSYETIRFERETVFDFLIRQPLLQLFTVSGSF
jgi:putative transposase